MKIEGNPMVDEKVMDNPEAILQQFRSMMESYLSDMGKTSSSNEAKAGWSARVSRLASEYRAAQMTKIPTLDDTQKLLQADYLRVIILLQDVERTAQNFDAAMQAGNINEGLRELRIGLMAYYLSDAARKKFSWYGKDDDEICELSKKLAPRMSFLAHMRNYIAGHLHDKVLEKACQWGGYCLFAQNAMNTPAQMLLANKFILEAAINCCIASKSADKNMIKDEIDLAYPPDYKYFTQFMSETYNLTIAFLSKVKAKIATQLTPYVDEKEMMVSALWAGDTDFAID